jgi:hypothetical protein
VRGTARHLGGVEVFPLDVTASQLTQPLPISFETACERLAQLPRMFCEPDGSFVWVADDAERTWQVDGNLYDGPAGLMYVELKGACPESKFREIIACCGEESGPLAFQLLREAIFLDEAELLRWLHAG